MEFQEIDRRTVVQQVADQLREAVIKAVQDSSQLPGEASLSRALTVSRPTLREALRILEAEGLITRDARTASVRPDVGAPSLSRPLRSALTVLSRTERISLTEIFDLRSTIEGGAARRAAEVATPDDLARLEAALAAERAAANTGGDSDHASFEFHVAMVKASHNEAFLLVMLAAREAAAGLLERAAALAREKNQRSSYPEVAQDHEYEIAQQTLANDAELYEAIRDGRGDEAASMIATTMRRLIAPLATEPAEIRPRTRS